MSVHNEIHRFLRRTKMAETRFGRLAIRDPRLLSDLRRGRQLTPRLEATVRRFMETYA